MDGSGWERVLQMDTMDGSGWEKVLGDGHHGWEQVGEGPADGHEGWEQETTLAHAELPDTVEGVTKALKKHKDFTTTLELNLQKVQLVLQAGESLRRQCNIHSDRVAEAMEGLRVK
ncbi:hypothetical protein DV515_00017772 [Chloebia gouldiae]|uniref:Uncharacterized protein n=1 Tax=Chloebia gouldiae TaxID=44316 RepID=A0A3L8Q9F1_CHLGU|nr:hypothetical protein DV515_00017772 [Chloebia gouldiae]